MGEHRQNPGAAGYIGALPDVILNAKLEVRVVPSMAFMKQTEEMRAAGIDGPINCPEKDRDVVVVIATMWTIPQRTVDPRKEGWPTATVPMGELMRVPLASFKALHKKAFEDADMKHLAASIVVEEEPVAGSA